VTSGTVIDQGLLTVFEELLAGTVLTCILPDELLAGTVLTFILPDELLAGTVLKFIPITNIIIYLCLPILIRSESTRYLQYHSLRHS
jgi:hypothetical protein